MKIYALVYTEYDIWSIDRVSTDPNFLIHDMKEYHAIYNYNDGENVKFDKDHEVKVQIEEYTLYDSKESIVVEPLSRVDLLYFIVARFGNAKRLKLVVGEDKIELIVDGETFKIKPTKFKISEYSL